MKPIVSIAMPLFCGEKFLSQSISSIQNQTLSEWELFVVDDCSTDNSAEIARSLACTDDRIHFIQLKHNSGPAVARNVALESATGKYMAFLDSDDLWNRNKLEKQVSFMEKMTVEFSCTAYDRISDDGLECLGRVTPFSKADYNKVLYSANPVGNSTAMYSREKLHMIRVPEIRKRNDFALWLEILKHTDYVYGMQECLAKYRVRTNSISSGKLGLVQYQWELYRNVEKLSIPHTMLAFGGLLFTKCFHPTWRHGKEY